MSPIHDNLHYVPDATVEELKKRFGGGVIKKYAPGGFFSDLRDGGSILSVSSMDEDALKRCINMARNSGPKVHLVWGFCNPNPVSLQKRANKVAIEKDLTLDDKLTLTGWSKEYRGNHRSHNKGKGLANFLDKPRLKRR